jgi:hypothetical protein
MPIRKFRASRVNSVTSSEFVGQHGDVFYDEDTGQFRVSDGTTPGGHIVQTTLNLLNGTADVFVNNIVVNGTSTTINNIVSNNETTVTGVLSVTGNASFTGNTEFVGTTTFTGPIISVGTRTSLGNSIFNGNVTTNGNLIVVGPSYFYGNITEVGNLVITGQAINNGPSIFNGAMVIAGDTSIVGNVVQSGNLTIRGVTVNNGLSVFNGNIAITGNAVISGNTNITGIATLTGNSYITGNTFVTGTATLTGNSYITGNTFVTGPTTVTGNVNITGNSIQTGVSKYIVSTDASNYGALTITGNVQGLVQPPALPGVMLHVTGQDNGTTPGRAYVDSNRQYSIIVGRRYNGTVANPTQAVTGDEVFRLAGTGYPTGGWPLTGLAQIRFIADENQTQTNRGGHLDFLTVPIGSNVVTQVMSVSATTGVTVSGNLTATNVIANTVGTLTGNVNGTIMTAYQPNITSVGTLANLTVDGAGGGSGLTVQGNLRYDIAYGNGTVTQLTDKSTAVTCNGRTGQITTAASSIAKGTAVTFTVNNSYVTAVTDLPIVAFQGGASTNSYAVSVTRVQVGSFNITISNNGTGPLTDTIIINFAVMKIS